MEAYFGEKKEKYQLSVVVPVYNVEKYVEQCLSSVLPQKELDIQLIVVNDGSTDNSLNVVKRFIERNAGLVSGVIVTQENQGLSGARNKGLLYVKGKYINFLDSDDFVLPLAYNMAYRLAKSENCEIVWSRAVSFDDKTLDTWPFNDSHQWDKILNGKQYKILNGNSCPEIYGLEPSTCVRLISREFAEQIKLQFPVGLHYEDIYLHIKMCERASKIGLLDNLMYYYRTNRIGKITEERSNKRLDIIAAVSSVANDKKIIKLSSYQGKYIVDQLVKISFWCGRNALGDDRKSFFIKLSKAFKKLPKNWLKSFEKSSIFDFRHRYICKLLVKEKIRLLSKLSASSPSKISIGLFLLSHCQLDIIRQQLFHEKISK